MVLRGSVAWQPIAALIGPSSLPQTTLASKSQISDQRRVDSSVVSTSLFPSLSSTRAVESSSALRASLSPDSSCHFSETPPRHPAAVAPWEVRCLDRRQRTRINRTPAPLSSVNRRPRLNRLARRALEDCSEDLARIRRLQRAASSASRNSRLRTNRPRRRASLASPLQTRKTPVPAYSVASSSSRRNKSRPSLASLHLQD